MQTRGTYKQPLTYAEQGFGFAWITAIVILSGLLLYRVLLIFSYNGEVGGIDNNFVYDVARSIGGLPIYTNPSEPPYAITLYSPLYYNICSLLGTLLHIDPADPIQVYRLCRTFSLICDITTCVLLFQLVRKRFQTKTALSALTVSCFACIICLLGYTFSRSDSLLLTFYAATFYVLTGKSPHNNKHLQLILLAALSICCILSKQNGLLMPVLISAWLFLQSRKQQVIYFLMYFWIFGMVLLLYEQHYHYLFQNTVIALNNRIDLGWFYTDIFKRMMNSLWIIPLFIGAVLATKQWFNPASREDKSLAFVFAIQTTFSLATSLKWGSTAGYLNESLFLAFILITRKTATFQTPMFLLKMKKTVAILMPLLFLFFIHTVTEGYLFFIQNQKAKKERYQQQKEVRDYLEPKLDGHSVMNLAQPNSDFFKTLLYKNITVPNMDMVDCCTLPDNTFNYSLLKKHLMDGHISHLIMQGDVQPTSAWDVSLHHFQKDTSINGYTIYKFHQ